MLGARGPALRAGGRQLTRVLSGLQSKEGSQERRCCGQAGAPRGGGDEASDQAVLAHQGATNTTITTSMPGTQAAYPTLEKLGLLAAEHIKIQDLARVEGLINTIVDGGFSKMQLVVDFDFTLTRVHMGGQRCHCSWGIMDNSHIMPDFYREEANNLLAKYYPIEVDPKMTEEEKIPHMEEWYDKIHDLLVKCKVSRTSLEGMVQASNTRLRDGAEELFLKLHQAEVPVLVLSAGMGDVLEQVLKHFKVYTDNVKVVANFFDYNDEGIMVGFKGKQIHMFNKNEDAIHSSDYFEKLCHRSNVILMGDSQGDVKMALGVPHPSTVLKIGFLNDKIEERLDAYMKIFDIVLIDDQTMDVASAIVALMK